MISICSLSCNNKNELTTFVEALVHYNKHVNFEICIAHDDRVEDGSSENLKKLQDKYPQLKVVKNTKQDAINYLRTLVSYYEVKNIFPQDLRAQLLSNLLKYERDELCIPDKSFLWLALGYLFNKAANIASGDILVFLPCDYVWTANLVEMEGYVIQHRRNGMFYGKFSGLYDPISNEPVEVLSEIVRKPIPPCTINRNYVSYPSALEEHFLLDFQSQSLRQLGHQDYPAQFIEQCRRAKGTSRLADMHHGTHIMTRKVWDIIGGFTEEFYGRAWPDDKMNAHAMRAFWADSSTMPIEFSFSFIHQAQWQTSLSGLNPEFLSKEELLITDPYIFNHPIQGRHYNQIYLHDGYHDKEYTRIINGQLDKEFGVQEFKGREAPIVRLVK